MAPTVWGLPPAMGPHTLSVVLRLYSNFAHGRAGVGLLLIRLVVGADVLFHGIAGLRLDAPLLAILLHSSSIVLGLLLVAGLWTPVAGVLLALNALLLGYLRSDEAWWLLLGVSGIALALLGPGALSIDARLFGWKRIEIPERQQKDHPPS